MRAVEDFLRTSNPPASWIAARGEAALEQVRRQGLPHRRLEDWKYSDLREALNMERAAAVGDGASNPFTGLGFGRVEFVDGVSVTGFEQLPVGLEAVDLLAAGPMPVWVETLLGTLVRDGLSGAALALMSGGVALRVPSGLVLEDPIGLFFRST
ncbi:MAG: hypothetical protein KGO02_03315, partial [Alphaproteobacteria bacterium]|nr:hypothetical protein [Alphaproteobacteria bacterium]